METRPTIRLNNGRYVKSTFENEHYYFYNVRKEETAREICDKLLALGLPASVGHGGLGCTAWFVRVRHYDVFKD